MILVGLLDIKMQTVAGLQSTLLLKKFLLTRKVTTLMGEINNKLLDIYSLMS